MPRKTLFATIAVWIVATSALLCGVGLLSTSFLASFEWVKPRLDALALNGSANAFTVDQYRDILVRVRAAAVALAFVGGVLFLLRKRLYAGAERACSSLGFSWRAVAGGVSEAARREEKVHLVGLFALLLAAIILRLAFLFQPIRYDEAYTYLTYASKPFLVAISRYNAPNNHILNTVLAYASCALFGNAEWAIRLPAFVAGVMVVPATYVAARVLYRKHAALVAAALVASSSVLIEYSTNGRGYTMVCLFSLIALALAKRVKDQVDGGGWPLFAIAAAFGFYAVPIMLYPFAAVVVWYGLSICLDDPGTGRRRAFAHLFSAILLTVALTLMLYSPVLVISGLSPLIATSDGQATWGTFIRHTLSAFVATWSQWNRDIPVPLRLLLVLGFALSLIFHRRVAEDRMPLLAAILLGIAPILLAQRVVPFARVWLFLLPWYFVTAAPGLMFLLRPLEAKVGAGTTLFFALLSMVLSLWLGVGVVRSQSVVASPETGTLSDAQEIVSYLSGTLRPGELVVSDIPSNYPLRYYFVRSGLSASNLVEPSDVPESAERIIIVVNGQAHQTLDGILKAIPSARRAQLKEPVLLRRFSSASVYGY